MEAITRRITMQTCRAVVRSKQPRLQCASSLINVPKLQNHHNLSTSAYSSPRTSGLSPQARPPLSSRQPYRPFHSTPPNHSKSRFSYGIAASYTAKDVRYDPRRDTFHFDPHAPIHKRRKDKRTRPTSGQDAFFISRIGSSGDVAFGVADGVGGWADSGVDPADFSHGFCDYMAYTASSYTLSIPPLTAKTLMQKGYDAITRDESVSAGGSTACVGIARGDGSLEVANLGDSGFAQLRLNAVHQYSEPQTHAFNTPYQLSLIPDHMKAKNAAFGGTQLEDSPRDSAVSRHQLRHGDVLVFATDGVWDNLSSSDILRVVSKLMLGSRAWELGEDGIRIGEQLTAFTKMGNDVEGLLSLQSFLAVGIAGEAKAASINTKVDGPFAREVQRLYPEEDWRGGKVDDICVIVAIVVDSEAR